MKKQLILGLLALTSVGTVKPVSGTFSINDTLLETYVISWIALPIIGTVLGIYKGSKNKAARVEKAKIALIKEEKKDDTPFSLGLNILKGALKGACKGIVTMATITCALGTWMALHDIALNINS